MTAATVGRGARRVAGPAVVVATIVTLHLLGGGRLAPPPLRLGPGWSDWARSRDAVTIAFAVVRLAALAVAYHLALTSTVAALGHVLHRPAWVRAAQAWTLPPLRGTVARIVGLGLSTTLAFTTPTPSAGAASDRAPAVRTVGLTGSATLVRLGSDDLVVARVDGGRPDGTATLRLDPTPPTTTPGTVTVRPAPAPGHDAAPTPAPTPTRDHRVAPGDHLWAIAEAAVARAQGRPPTDAEIAPYWRAVLAANPQLADPDLIFPGDLIHLPPGP